MYILVAGGGVVGRNLVSQLVDKHDVVVIDQNQEICERLYSEYGAVSVQGSATRINTLREAGIKKADVAVAVMDSDANNLAFCLLAQNFGVEQIMARMRDPEYEAAYRQAGATTIAGIVDLMVEDFVLDIEQPEVRKVYSLSGGKAEISILTIPEDSVVIGQTVAQVSQAEEFPAQVLIAGLFDQAEDRLLIPRGNTCIGSKAQVFLVGPAPRITKAADYLTATK